MTRLTLTLACGDYDRTRGLEDGTVRPEGIRLRYLRLPVEEIFFRMLRFSEFEASEMSLSSYVMTLEQEPRRFVAIPVFPSRMFRHGCVYVRAGAGIDRPEDLIGRRVGTPEFQLTAGVWIRGILDEYHGVPVHAVRYRTGGQEQPGRMEKVPLDLPPRLDVRPIEPGHMLSQLLLDGELDALYTPRIPQPFRDRHPSIRRLFSDPVAAERSYFDATGIFPPMHVIVIRQDVYAPNRWVAQSLYQAFVRAKTEALERMYDSTALRVTLPWLTQQLEQAKDVLGDDFWSYGIQGNRHALDTFLRYHHQQGLSRKRWRPDELFATESLETVAI